MTVLAGDEVAAVVGQTVADGGQSDVVVGGHTVAAVVGQIATAVGVLAGRELGNETVGGQSDTTGSDVAGSEDCAVGLELASEVI